MFPQKPLVQAINGGGGNRTRALFPQLSEHHWFEPANGNAASGERRAGLVRALRRRDGNLCFYCGTEPNRASHHVDHVTPKSRGGSDHIDNLVFACRDCNLTKSTWSGWFFVIRGWSLGRWEVAA